MFVRDGKTYYECGDRVELIYSHPDGNQSLIASDTGTVVRDPDAARLEGENVGTTWVRVRWDHKVDRGHDADRRDLCPVGYGWNVPREYLRPVETINDEDTDYDLESEQELMSMLGVST